MRPMSSNLGKVTAGDRRLSIIELGLGASSFIVLGCTVGHGLTFTHLLGIGSLVGIAFIFLGSSLVGNLTRN